MTLPMGKNTFPQPVHLHCMFKPNIRSNANYVCKPALLLITCYSDAKRQPPSFSTLLLTPELWKNLVTSRDVDVEALCPPVRMLPAHHMAAWNREPHPLPRINKAFFTHSLTRLNTLHWCILFSQSGSKRRAPGFSYYQDTLPVGAMYWQQAGVLTVYYFTIN